MIRVNVNLAVGMFLQQTKRGPYACVRTPCTRNSDSAPREGTSYTAWNFRNSSNLTTYVPMQCKAHLSSATHVLVLHLCTVLSLASHMFPQVCMLFFYTALQPSANKFFPLPICNLQCCENEHTSHNKITVITPTNHLIYPSFGQHTTEEMTHVPAPIRRRPFGQSPMSYLASYSITLRGTIKRSLFTTYP